jgi:hypothetical protein
VKKFNPEQLEEQGKKVQKLGASIMLMGCGFILLIPIVAFLLIILL